MRSVSSFARDGDLIVVDTFLSGPRGKASAAFVLDTGAEITTMMPHVADLLGYCARDGERRTTVRSTLGEGDGYILRIANFSAMHIAIPRFPISVVDLHYDEVDGLIGMNFLNEMNFEVRPQEQRIRAELLLGGGQIKGRA